jgi:2',3'-cyclic-nucleotide 2'-phosphodiesterase (5'-nucleotidase family)
MKQKKLLSLILLLCAAVLAACSDQKDKAVGLDEQTKKSIVILYENDVHCGIDGYTRMAGMLDAISASDTAYAAAVCVGDFLQGNTIGAISKGQFIIDIMSTVGYDVVTLGNHEFDFGVPRMKQLLSQLNAPVVCCNFFDAGDQKPYFPPYVIRQYGTKRVAFVGAVTPETMISESYAFYDTNGVMLYDLKRDAFYQLIQQAVDGARSEGADYVVLLSHVGEKPQTMGFSSHLIVANTTGIDVVLDGHTHSVIPTDRVANRDGQMVTVTQTGTQFANMGKLVISHDGHISATLMPTADIPYESPSVTAATAKVRQQVKAVTSRVVAHSDYALTVTNADGSWMARISECNAGDLVADAYRHAMKSNVAFENAGGLRNNIASGDITYGSIIGLLPYDNTLRRIMATGAQIQEMLTRCTSSLPAASTSFPQCSGLRFRVHSKSHTVSDIEVLQSDGTYAPLNPTANYTVGITDHNHTGGGFQGCFSQCVTLYESDTRYYEALATYLTDVLQGSTGTAYAKPQGRIVIVDD